MTACVRNVRTGVVLAHRVQIAEDSKKRGIGFLFQESVPSDEGLLFERCWAVHTFGVGAVIDVIFLDAAKRVLRYVPGVTAHRPLWCPGARSVLELGAAAEPRMLAVGDALQFESDAQEIGRPSRFGM
ncbi:MAG: hypothetical protein NVSMB31_02640 [Vulcanimicrobiaceae bacterium]